MPDLLTPQTLATAGPILLDTLVRHLFTHKFRSTKGKGDGDAARPDEQDLLYDEAFTLMKAFLESATKYPIASLQKFGQTRTPAPPWVGVHRVHIPAPTLRAAAEHLVVALGGAEMAFKVAGGSKWWQVRAGGLEGEWIAMKRDYEPAVKEEKERLRRAEKVRAMRAKNGEGKEEGEGEDMGDGPCE